MAWLASTAICVPSASVVVRMASVGTTPLRLLSVYVRAALCAARFAAVATEEAWLAAVTCVEAAWHVVSRIDFHCIDLLEEHMGRVSLRSGAHR
jgi:hypothetical protein